MHLDILRVRRRRRPQQRNRVRRGPGAGVGDAADALREGDLVAELGGRVGVPPGRVEELGEAHRGVRPVLPGGVGAAEEEVEDEGVRIRLDGRGAVLDHAVPLLGLGDLGAGEPERVVHRVRPAREIRMVLRQLREDRRAGAPHLLPVLAVHGLTAGERGLWVHILGRRFGGRGERRSDHQQCGNLEGAWCFVS